MAITLLTITTALVLHAPPQHVAEMDTWESLAAKYERDTIEWSREMQRSGGWQKPAAERPPSPAARLWPRFEVLARQGDGRATVWLLQQAGADPERREERVAELLDLVARADEAPWVARAVTALGQHVEVLDEEALGAWLDGLIEDAEDRDLRVAARLVKADLLDDPAAAGDARLRAAFLKWTDVELGEDEPLEGEVLAVVTSALMKGLEEAERAWFRANFFQGEDGSYYQRAQFDPDPSDLWQGAVERAARLGQAPACLWVLNNVWPTNELNRQAWRDCLDVLAEVGLPADELEHIGWMADSWTEALGIEFVEPRLRALTANASDEARATVLMGLGKGLCDAATDDAQRERGLALLREVGERFPDSDAARRAAGKLFRYQNLVVGKEVPDFEAVDADGNAFKLSDYRGKVTVIDFWGFW